MSLTKVSYSMISGAPLSVLDYGAVGDGVANDTSAFAAAVAAAVAQSRALHIPAGQYKIASGGVNFAANNLHIFGDGNGTVLNFTGTGPGFHLLGGTAGNGVGEMCVEGLRIIGNANTTYGFYAQGVWRSTFRDIEVRECNTTAFYIRHGVSNVYDTLKYSINSNYTPTTIPTNGLILADNGTGYYTADCTFINAIMEGVSSGIYVLQGSGNTFTGGTSEGNVHGIIIDQGCDHNNIVGMWFEANTADDAVVDGTGNQFQGCYFGSTPSNSNVEVLRGNTTFIGGYIRTANLQSTSSNTRFFGCGLDQNLTGTLGITGPGAYKAVGLTKIDSGGVAVGEMPDVVGESGSFTATASGMTTSPTGTVYYHKIGKTVTLTIPTISGTSNATTFDLNILPAAIRPTNNQQTMIPVIDNGTYSVTRVIVQPNGYLVFYSSFSAANFTASGTKGVVACSISYLLN